jgi:hypothetical protein
MTQEEQQAKTTADAPLPPAMWQPTDEAAQPASATDEPAFEILQRHRSSIWDAD